MKQALSKSAARSKARRAARLSGNACSRLMLTANGALATR